MPRIVQCLSHSIESYDQLRLYTALGYEAVDIGGYITPSAPHDDKRPGLDAPFFPELKAAVDALGTADNLAAAQSRIPDAYLDWLGDDGAIIFHHYLDERLVPQWPRLRDWLRGHAGRRVIWRSVGQSVEHNERLMAPLRAEGLERVAYSPREANIPGYTGHDALIRFYKDPAEYTGWTGHVPSVINITQNLRQRHPYTNWAFWEHVTAGLPRLAMGPGSEAIGGVGAVGYDAMKQALRDFRVYLYSGTQPASYTLGLIEAMMTGIPVISITPNFMAVFPYGPDLFEGHEIAGSHSMWSGSPDGYQRSDEQIIANTRSMVRDLLAFDARARGDSARVRRRAVELFGMAAIGEQWRAFLGSPARAEFAHDRETVTA